MESICIQTEKGEMVDPVFLVVGTGKSGVCACKLLEKHHYSFVVYDENENLDQRGLIEKHPFLKKAEIICGSFPESLFERTNICVLSPGVSSEKVFVEKLRKKGVLIWGEVELAYRMGKGQIVAITGTNGKTTTTSLVGEILSMIYDDTRVVGNIGIPYTDMVDDTTDETMVVAEISSFQLETSISFHPNVSAILNITPDHLDRHHTMDNYIKMKESITANQGAKDFCVLNYDDSELKRFGEELDERVQVVFFSGTKRLLNGVYYEDGAIYSAKEGEAIKVIDVSQLQILGRHNYENAAAATAICQAFGVSLDIIRKGLREFVAVAHRIEFICEKNGVAFYNDSKGTNPDAAIKAVEAMVRPTILIGGGYDKNSTYDEWIESFGDKVKKLVLIGETSQKIADTAAAHGFTEVEMAGDLKDALDRCYKAAVPGDAILLSPACASWDMFKSYEERGRLFSEYARAL